MKNEITLDVLARTKQKHTKGDYTGLANEDTETPRVYKSLVNIARHAGLGIDHVPDRNVLPESITGDGGIILGGCP